MFFKVIIVNFVTKTTKIAVCLCHILSASSSLSNIICNSLSKLLLLGRTLSSKWSVVEEDDDDLDELLGANPETMDRLGKTS